MPNLKRNKKYRNFPLFKLLTGCICISFAPIFIKLAALPPDSAGFYRMLIAAVSLFLLMVLRKEPLQIENRSILLLLSSGIFLAVDFMCWHRSIDIVGPGIATLVANFQVFFTALFSWLFLKQKISRLFIFSMIMAVIGLQLITKADWSSPETNYLLGIGFGLLAALFYSGYILLVKESMNAPGVRTLSAMYLVAIASSSFLLSVSLLGETPLAIPNTTSFVAIAGAGVVSTTLGWSLLASAIKFIPATIAGLVLLLQPTLALIWDTLIFDKPTGTVEVFGILLILVAIYIGSRGH